MVLVDTSVWVDHLRKGNHRLVELLEEGLVCCHPFVIGEIACGFLKNRKEILSLLRDLPQAPVADPEEFILFVERHTLMGGGIGFVDVHLLAGAMLSGCSLFTLDKKLGAESLRLNLT